MSTHSTLAWEFVKQHYPKYHTSSQVAFVNSIYNRSQGQSPEEKVNVSGDYKVSLLQIYLRSVESYIAKSGAPFVTITGFVLFFGKDLITEETKQGVGIYFITHGNDFKPLVETTPVSEKDMFFIDSYIQAMECAFCKILEREGHDVF
jgi:hypothetical protein